MRTEEQRLKHNAYMREWNRKHRSIPAAHIKRNERDRLSRGRRHCNLAIRSRDLERQRYWNDLRRSDPEKHEKEKQVQRDRQRQRYIDNPVYREKVLVSNRVFRKRILSDPDKKGKYLAYNREYRRERRATDEDFRIREATRLRLDRSRRKSAGGCCSIIQWRQRGELYGWHCAYCGTQLDFCVATIDHVVPIIKGGCNWPSNLVPACASCNSRKNSNVWQPRLPQCKMKF